MLMRIKKLQFLCGLCMLLQIVFNRIILPFHFIAVLLSIIIIIWQQTFRVLQIKYQYFVIVLYAYRIFLLLVFSMSFLETIYLCLCLYVAFMLLLISCKTFL